MLGPRISGVTRNSSVPRWRDALMRESTVRAMFDELAGVATADNLFGGGRKLAKCKSSPRSVIGKSALTLCTALTISGFGFAASAQTYTAFDPSGATQTTPTGINAKDSITGNFIDGVGVTHGFLRIADGTFTTFDAPAATFTYPQAINRTGLIAGNYLDYNDISHGFVRRKG